MIWRECLMAKKEKTPIINNIKELNVDIDYDKLADAIVVAQKKAIEKENENAEAKKKENIFSAIWKILKGKKSDDGRYISAPFVVIVSLFYRIIALFGFLALIVFDIVGITSLVRSPWNEAGRIFINILSIIFIVLISICVFLFSIMFWGAANDIEYEKDKNYILGTFSGLISVAALIVAIIALYN